MKFFDWRIRAGLVLVLMFAIFISSQFIIYSRYKTIAKRETENASIAVANYIDSYIDSACNLINGFAIYDNMSDSLIEMSLRKYVEKGENIVSMIYIVDDGHIVSYSVNDDKHNQEKLLQLYEEIILSNQIYVKLHKDENVIHVCKKINNAFNNNAVIIADIDINQICEKLNSIKLYSSKLNYDVKDIYGERIYSNYAAEIKDEIKIEVTGLSSSYEENIIQVAFKEIGDTFIHLFGNNDSTMIRSNYSSKYDLFTISTSAYISDLMYYYQTRLVITVAEFAILIFLLAVLVIFIDTQVGKTKIYVIGVVLFEIIIILFFANELSAINVIVKREIEQQSEILYETTFQLNESQNRYGELVAELLKESSKNVDLELSVKQGLLNNFMYLINKDNKYLVGTYIYKNNELMYAYPYDRTNDKLDFDNFVRYYDISKDYKLAIQYNTPNYSTYFGESGLIKYHPFDEENSESKESLYYKYIEENDLKEININLKYVKKFKLDSFKGNIFVLSSPTQVVSIYDFEIENDFAYVLMIAIITCLCEILMVLAVRLYVKIRESKQNKYESEMKKDMILLDKLLKKINDDVAGINNSFGEESETLIDDLEDE